MSGLISGDALRAAAKHRRTLDVEVEGTGTIRLRSLSARDALKFRAEVVTVQAAGGDPESLAPSLIARSWIGEDGELLVPEEEGAVLILELEAAAFNKLATATLVLNGLKDDAVKAAVGNSEAIRTDSPPTGSPSTSDTPTST